MSGILKELKQAQVEKEYNQVWKVFDQINELCKELSDMDAYEFLKYKERVIADARWHKCGPYKLKKQEDIFNDEVVSSNIGKKFQENMIDDMDRNDIDMNPYDNID